MKNPDETVEQVRRMDYDQLVEAAGLTGKPVPHSTYLYVDTDGDIVSISMERGGEPADEYFSIGFAHKLRGV